MNDQQDEKLNVKLSELDLEAGKVCRGNAEGGRVRAGGNAEGGGGGGGGGEGMKVKDVDMETERRNSMDEWNRLRLQAKNDPRAKFSGSGWENFDPAKYKKPNPGRFKKRFFNGPRAAKKPTYCRYKKK
ncbi:predicted protein [Chaetoceros tenuissimus]|uniref:Uncharacterized protein n=1 Tax=Chaetoceros tenuissimus TaxID=426638 RepID=A0AAD3CY23_9STRA|nr:predicted protein [Chaetoceros tenuissimus]